MSDTLSTIGFVILGVGLLAMWTICPIVTALKGKWGMVAAGLLVHPCWIFGAIRLAKPDSFWARRFYSNSKMQLALDRFDPHLIRESSRIEIENEPPSLPHTR